MPSLAPDTASLFSFEGTHLAKLKEEARKPLSWVRQISLAPGSSAHFPSYTLSELRTGHLPRSSNGSGSGISWGLSPQLSLGPLF